MARRSSSILRPNISAGTAPRSAVSSSMAANFPWDEHKERQPALNTPDPSYHGAVWAEAAKPLGPIAYILKARTTLLRDLGSAMAPFNAFLTLQGIETLPLRIERHSSNRVGGCGLARQALCGHERDPSFGSERRSEEARGQISQGRLGRTGRIRDQGRPGTRGANSSTRSSFSITSPISATPARSPSIRRPPPTRSSRPQSRRPPASRTNYVRLSIGIEHIDDILADLDQALKAAA